MKFFYIFRRWLGMKLLDWTMRILPACSVLSGMRRGLREQREYDRYLALALLLNGQPMPFGSWRQTREWIRTRPEGRLRDLSRPFVVRESFMRPL